MPMPLKPETLQEKTADELRDLKWFLETVTDLFYKPGATQETFEDDLRTLRAAYRERSMDKIFLQMFARVREALHEKLQADDAGLMLRVPYTADDFLYSAAPYEEIAAETDPFLKRQVLSQLDKTARSVGVKHFTTLWKEFDKRRRKCYDDDSQFPLTLRELQLQTAGWHIDQTGIWTEGRNGQEYACPHLIAPVRRLTNIDTGEEKLTIAFERSGYIREITRSKRELFDSAKILDLAAVGVAVTSQSSKILSRYLCEIEHENYDEIPQQDSVSRLGFLPDGRFSPYVDELAFDGDAAYGNIFRAIRRQGDFEAWRSCANRCRSESITAQIMLAASFASVLIRKLGGLPFFVHLWGVDSGTGKTVALMLAASVWGDPELGQYPQTFNATVVGHEKTAAFLNNIPLCIDELQLSKDSHGRSRFDVYQLAQGVGRTRGNKAGGVDMTPTWSLCILTTGESPIVQDNAGAGAHNRVIDIECRAQGAPAPNAPCGAKVAVIQDGAAVCKVIKSNFGHAGRKFVESLTPERLAQAQELYDMYFQKLSSGETTEKQAMAAAMLLTADAMADVEIFKSGKHLTLEEISEFLKSKASVSAGERGYSYLCDWVAMNSSKFSGEKTTDTYGILDGDYAYINRSVFRNACRDGGFDERALLSWLKVNGKIQSRARAFTKPKRINHVVVECVVLQLPSSGVSQYEDDDELL